MYIFRHTYRKLDAGCCHKKFWVFFCEKFSFFLPQVLYHKSRGRDGEYIPVFYFKFCGWKTLKMCFSLYTHAV